MSDREHTAPPEGNEEPGAYVVRDRRWWANGEESDSGGEERKPSFVEALEARIRDLTEKVAAAQNGYKDALEEFERAKGRVEREARKEAERDKASAFTLLLDVLDDLERAIEAARDGADESSLLAGVALVRDNFLAALKKVGVERMEAAEGDPFDANVHDAVASVPVPDSARAGTIVGIIKAGYTLGEHPLRPAQVAVGQAVEGGG